MKIDFDTEEITLIFLSVLGFYRKANDSDKKTIENIVHKINDAQDICGLLQQRLSK